MKKIIALFVAGLLAQGAVHVFTSQVSAQAQVVSGRIVPAQTLAPAALVKAPAPPVNPRATRFSDTSVKVKWGKVSGARSYLVFEKQSGQWRKIGVVAGTVWYHDRVGQRSKHSYRIVSCSLPKGAGRCGEPSISVSAMTYRRGDDTVNAGVVLLADPVIVPARRYRVKVVAPLLGVRDTWQLDPKVEPAKWGASKAKRVWDKTFTYTSSNPGVARVSARGLVEGVRVGTALITVRAHNGNLAYVRVRVKDFTAALTKWSQWGMYDGIREITSKYSRQLARLARYGLDNPTVNCGFALFPEDGSLDSGCGDSSPQPESWVIAQVEQILTDPICPYRVILSIFPKRLYLQVYLNDKREDELYGEGAYLEYKVRRYPDYYWERSKGYNHWDQTYYHILPLDESPAKTSER